MISELDSGGRVTELDSGGRITEVGSGGRVSEVDSGGRMSEADNGGRMSEADNGGRISEVDAMYSEESDICSETALTVGRAVDLLPTERMRQWLMFEIDSSAPLRFEEAILLKCLDSQKGDDFELVRKVAPSVHGDTIYCPKECRDGVVFGDFFGGDFAKATGAEGRPRSRFCIDCRGATPAFHMSTMDSMGYCNITRIQVSADNTLHSTNYTFHCTEPDQVLAKAQITERKLCDYCSARDEQVCSCPSSFRERTIPNLEREFERMNLRYGMSQPDNNDNKWLWTDGLAMVSKLIFTGKFDMLRTVQSGLTKPKGRKSFTDGGLKSYVFCTEGTELMKCKEYYAQLYYQEKSALKAIEFILDDSMFEDLDLPLLPEVEELPEAEEIVTVKSKPQTSSVSSFCPACNAGFKRKYEMQRHFRTVHLGERKFACELCNHKFIHKSHLRVHISSVHEGVSEATCPECGKDFATKAKVNRHILAVHRKQRNITCETCGKKFFQRSDLKKHEQAHERAEQELVEDVLKI